MNVKDNRSFWFYLLLTFLTCGLYSIYFWYVYVEDLNTIFYSDGEDSPNYIIVLLLSWVTCGIYGVYWRYKQANRMYRESYDRYGVMIEENGSAILLWTLLGYLTGGPSCAYYTALYAYWSTPAWEKVGRVIAWPLLGAQREEAPLGCNFAEPDRSFGGLRRTRNRLPEIPTSLRSSE